MGPETRLLVRRRAQYVILVTVFSSYLFILHQELGRGAEGPSQGLAVMRGRAETLRRRCRQLRSEQRQEQTEKEMQRRANMTSLPTMPQQG